MVPNGELTPPWPVPLSPTEAHGFAQIGQNPDDWMALIVQVPGTGLAMGSPPSAEDVVIVQTTVAIPSAAFAPRSRLVAMPEHIPPVEVGGVSVRMTLKRSSVTEALRVPVHEGWEVVVDWNAPRVSLTAYQQHLLDRYVDDESGELRTLTMHEAQALQAHFPGSTVRPIARSTELPTSGSAGAVAAPELEAAAAAASAAPAEAAVVLVERTAQRLDELLGLAAELPAADGSREMSDLAAIASGRDPRGAAS